MRSRTALLIVVAVAAGFTQSHAATSLPNLAGKSNFSAEGPRAALVNLPRAVTVNVQNPSSWIRFATPPWGLTSVMIDGVSVRGTRAAIFYARLAAPAGCDLAGSCTPVEAVGVRLSTNQSFVKPATPTVTLAPGTYRVYVLGDPNFWSTKITLLLSGLSGATSLVAKTPVIYAANHRSEAPLNTIAAHPESYPRTDLMDPQQSVGIPDVISGQFLLVGGAWKSAGMRDAPQTPSVLSSCWTRYTPDNRPDYWWQNPEYLASSTSPLIAALLPCRDQADLQADRVFARVAQPGSWTYHYTISPVIDRAQRYGAFAISVRFLDAQG